MTEPRGEYLTGDQQAILARLLEVFTPGQLLHLAELASELAERRFGRIEIRVRGDRLFMDKTTSDDCGKIISH